MANKKISQLPPATDVVGAEVEIIQGGVNKRASSSLFGGSTSTPTLQEVRDQSNIIDVEGEEYITFNSLENFRGAIQDGGSVDGVGYCSSDGTENTIYFNKKITVNNVSYPLPNSASSRIATLETAFGIVISSNTTASNDTNYSVVANATFTDPTPVEGKGYMVTVINGTATIGGVGYTVGQKVFRHFHSGSWRSFVYGGSGTISTLQEVTEAGAETTVKTIFRTSETEWVEIGGDRNGISVYNDAFGSLPTPKKIIEIAYNSLGVNSYDIDGEPTGSAGIGDKTLIATETVGGVQGKYTTIYPDKIVKGIDGTTSFDSFLPSEDNDLNGSKVISANTTAKNAINYLAVANLTMTDITPPSEGAFYEVTVINGTATIGGVGYTVGQKVFRHFHSGSWRTFVYPSLLQLDNFLRDETLLKGYICLTPSGINAPSNFKDVTYSSSATTGYILQNAYGKTGAIAMVGFQSTAAAGTVGLKRRNDSYNFSNTNAHIWQKIEFDSNVSGARFHHILSNNYQFTAPTNVEPNTIINCVGFCKLSTSGNLHVIHNDNTGTATTIDLGASFPANNSGGNKRYLLGIQIKASSYVLTVIEINTTTNALTTNIYTTEVSSDIPSRTLNFLQISTMITNNATASNATYLDGGFTATNII
jgi:hypothetical protein